MQKIINCEECGVFVDLTKIPYINKEENCWEKIKLCPTCDNVIDEKPWECWCGRNYTYGKFGHSAVRHKNWHVNQGDGRYKMFGSKKSEKPFKMMWCYIRDMILERDGHRCVVCGILEEGYVPQEDMETCFIPNHGRSTTEVHHIIRREDGGTNHMTNLITLCSTCHSKTKSSKAIFIDGLMIIAKKDGRVEITTTIHTWPTDWHDKYKLMEEMDPDFLVCDLCKRYGDKYNCPHYDDLFEESLDEIVVDGKLADRFKLFVEVSK